MTESADGLFVLYCNSPQPVSLYKYIRARKLQENGIKLNGSVKLCVKN